MQLTAITQDASCGAIPDKGLVADECERTIAVRVRPARPSCPGSAVQEPNPMERPCLRRERAAPDRRRKYEHEGFEDGGFLQSADEMSFIGRRPPSPKRANYTLVGRRIPRCDDHDADGLVPSGFMKRALSLDSFGRKVFPKGPRFIGTAAFSRSCARKRSRPYSA